MERGESPLHAVFARFRRNWASRPRSAYVDQLHALERLELGPDWLRAVCHGNAVKLFGL